jgi:hypothetical protein
VTEDELSKIVDVDDLDDMENENDVPNKTFLNPSQDYKLSSAKILKCEMCDFVSESKTYE